MAFFANIGASLNHWGEHQLGPALGEAAKAADEFGKNKLGPALVEVGKGLDQFGKTKLEPMMVEVSKSADHFGRYHLGPALGEVGKALDEFGKNKLGPAVSEAAKAADEFGKNKLGPALGGMTMAAVDFGQHKVAPAMVGTAAALDDFGKNTIEPALDILPGETGKWIKEHPTESAMIAGGVVGFILPGVLSTPILWAFGFGTEGVRLASAASAIQSKKENVPARGNFATLQSAGMGGYGAGVVHVAVKAGAAILGAIGIWRAVETDEEKALREKEEEKFDLFYDCMLENEEKHE